jgi:molybdopterin-binding protein
MEVTMGEVAANVSLRVGDNHMVALIARESVDELGLQPGMKIIAVVNATDVVILTGEGGIA